MIKLGEQKKKGLRIVSIGLSAAIILIGVVTSSHSTILDDFLFFAALAAILPLSVIEVIENRWKDSAVDVIVVFARNANFGFVIPAFDESKRKLNAEGHEQFARNKKNEFLKAFHKV